jgi:hypothetical protein
MDCNFWLAAASFQVEDAGISAGPVFEAAPVVVVDPPLVVVVAAPLLVVVVTEAVLPQAPKTMAAANPQMTNFPLTKSPYWLVTLQIRWRRSAPARWRQPLQF